MSKDVTNIVVAGLGGQGVLTCANIIASAAFRAGFDVKESEIHGMSQRGGSVTSDVRFGSRVWSPMITSGEADYLIVLSPGQEERTRHYLRSGGTLIGAAQLEGRTISQPATANVALLGRLSRCVPIPEKHWREAIEELVPYRFVPQNLEAFSVGLQP